MPAASALVTADSLLQLGIHSTVGEDLLVAFGLVTVVGPALVFIAKPIRWLLKRLLELRADEEQRKRWRARQLFAHHVESRIRDLDHQEEWSDHRFAELEAEVETLGAPGAKGWRGRLRRSRGLRREKSLSQALRKNRDHLILLQGDPGSGKSVALRFVARQMAERVANTRHADGVIPIYVNLKSFEPPPGKIDARAVEDFVFAQLLEGGDRDVDTFLDQEFAAGKQEGRWFFLFDSFDEIPAVLGATEEDDTVRDYSDAIRSFAHGMNSCRTIVASRAFHAPSRYGLPRFWIVPLSEPRKRELVAKAGLNAAQMKLAIELPDASADVVALSSNPLFLGLLCDFVRNRGDLPSGWHDVFEEWVGHRIDTDAARLQAQFGLDRGELRRLSEEIAFTMNATPNLGLSPTRSSLTAAYEAAGFGSAHQIAVVIDALRWSKLARLEGAATTDPSFSFSHRRLQEYFATNVVLREPDRVSVEELLTSASWRETVVTLLQAHRARAVDLVEHAHHRIRLAEQAVQHSDRFSWQPGVLHILGVLQNGLAGDAAEMPRDVSSTVGRLLWRAWRHGTIADRKLALEVAGIAPPGLLARLVEEAMRGQSAWLREAAFRQVARLSRIPPAVAIEVRLMLLRRFARRQLWREWPTIRAELLRLDPAGSLFDAARLLRSVPAIDLLLLVALAGIGVSAHGRHEAALVLVGGLGAIVLLANVTLQLLAAPIGRRFAPSDPAVEKPMAVARQFVAVGLVATLGITARWTLGAWLWVAPGGFGIRIVHEVIAVYLASWSLAAVVDCVLAPPRSIAHWPFVHMIVPQQAIARWARSLLRHFGDLDDVGRRSLVIGLVLAAVLLAALVAPVVVVGDALTPSLRELLKTVEPVLRISMAVTLGAIVVVFGGRSLAKIVRGELSDRLWLRRWLKSGPPPMSSRELLSCIAKLNTDAGVRRLLAEVRTRRLVHDDASAGTTIRDLIWASEHREDDSQPEWTSPSFAAWAAQEDGSGLSRLKDISYAALDEMGRLLEEMQTAVELPSA